MAIKDLDTGSTETQAERQWIKGLIQKHEGDAQQPKRDASPQTEAKEAEVHATTPPRHHATAIPRHHDTNVSPYTQEVIERLRGMVKILGKEAATHRFTTDEKRALANIEFEFMNKGIRTSENQLTRIAVNFLLVLVCGAKPFRKA